jgi:hypothetical protein
MIEKFGVAGALAIAGAAAIARATGAPVSGSAALLLALIGKVAAKLDEVFKKASGLCCNAWGASRLVAGIAAGEASGATGVGVMPKLAVPPKSDASAKNDVAKTFWVLPVPNRFCVLIKILPLRSMGVWVKNGQMAQCRTNSAARVNRG